ncbi:hypothetical protein LOK49_LG08G02522 [Camellia lanceoleosa]|uniref:Uncharacterized protein n=1 Tax=Camellia lanceoleosa TaxID=1840588 RepID=A0ACC0GT63_9ERIC|nr:hypothetical protein LOK49_LG08G02522 [Camellia lanceoleosa]
MASAQVLPNLAKKQEHLEAGKRRLEEFRRRKQQTERKGSQTQENNDDFTISTGATGRNVYGIITDQSVAFHPQAEANGNSSQPSQYGLEETHLKDNDSHLKDFTFGSPTSHVTVANVSLENSGSFLLQYNYGYSRPLATGLTLSSYEDSIQPSTKITESYFQVGQNIHAVTESTNTVISDMGERNSLSHFQREHFDGRRSSSHVPLYPAVAEISTRRSRPSILDSINMPKDPLTEPGRVESSNSTPFTETETIHPFSKLRDPNVASAFEHSMTSTVSARNGDDMYGHTFNENMDRRHDSYSRKQDEDFAALEQWWLPDANANSWEREWLQFNSVQRRKKVGLADWPLGLATGIHYLQLHAKPYSLLSSKQSFTVLGLNPHLSVPLHIEDLTQENSLCSVALEASQTLAESLASENSH